MDTGAQGAILNFSIVTARSNSWVEMDIRFPRLTTSSPRLRHTTPQALAQHLAANPQLAQPWKFLQKRRKKEAKLDAPPASSRHERDFIPQLLHNFLQALEAWALPKPTADGDEGAAAAAAAAAEAEKNALSTPRSRYLERSLELIIDLLAQLPTRRFFHAVMLDCHLIERAKLCSFYTDGGLQAAECLSQPATS